MKKNITKFLFAFVLFVTMMLALSMLSSAKEYYVDVNGGKDNSDGSSANPFSTIQKAANVVKPGDTVIIRPGIYYENVELKTNGTKDAPIVFKAEKFEKPVFLG